MAIYIRDKQTGQRVPLEIPALKGEDGKSAYDLWLEEGNQGTIDDFLLSLKGKDGEQGLQGEKGVYVGDISSAPETADIVIDDSEKGFFNADLVRVPIVDSVLNLTTDRLQMTDMEDETTIILPEVDVPTTICLHFDTTSELTLILPNIMWQTKPIIEANKRYEFIFSYVDEWLGGVLSYEKEVIDE